MPASRSRSHVRSQFHTQLAATTEEEVPVSVSKKSNTHVTGSKSQSHTNKEEIHMHTRKSNARVTGSKSQSHINNEEVPMNTKKSNAHVTSTESTPNAAVVATETTSSPQASPVTPSVPPALVALVAAAMQTCDQLEASLGLNIVVRQNDKAQMRALNRVSLTALGLASDIVTAAPARFPDLAGLAALTAYVETMTPLVARVSELASHIQNSILNQQAPAAQQALVLYSMVKGLGRMDVNQTMRDKIGQLKAELVPDRKDPKPKLTKTEKAAKLNAKRLAARIAKAKQFVAANDPTASSSSSATASIEASPVVTPAPKAVVATPPAALTNGAPAPAAS